jgi:DNA-binding SARP family transcriptional activator
MEEDNNLLEHAVINQIETDLNDKDYDALSEMIKNLIHLEPARKVLIEYLSDTAKENWLEGKTSIRY